MYKCGICRKNSKPRQARLVHIIYRKVVKLVKSVTFLDTMGRSRTDYTNEYRDEIEREVPVCHECKKQLDKGYHFEYLCDEQAEIRAKEARRPTQLTSFPTRAEARAM